ncbi:MAG TPA: hypothetical protein VL588_04785 [Bdellovibrionota bacterium]|jgi:hypothetical protein|nr:hypothetical protein [Bdellovibrionota bacterium]
MNHRIPLTLAAAAILSLSTSAFAAKFANQFVEFELPPKWQCNLEGAEWVCQSTDAGKKRDAIIILAAKLKGDQDSLDQYLTYLKKPKAYTSIKGQPVQSDPKYAKIVQLAENQSWVDSLHMESEIPSFYTRYLATVKQDIGVLVTYSINKNKYSEYLNDFEAMVKTLKVFRKAGGINAGPANGDLFKQAAPPPGITSGTVFGNVGDDAPARPVQQQQKMPLGYLIGGGAVVAFIILRRMRGGGGS